MVGAKGAALSLAKHLLTIWWWSIKVQGWDICLPAPMVLNIGQFMTWEEVLKKVDDSLWFEAYSHTLQRVREAMCGQQWQWPKGKVWEVGVSPMIRAFWEETGVKLATSCTRLCWEPPPRGVFKRRERGVLSHTITFLDNVAVCVPMLNSWDQFVWLLSVAMPRATTEVEQYGYHHGNAIDLGPVMPAMQFRVTDEEGTYLCVAQAIVFGGSVALTNYVPRVPQEVDCIAELGAHHLVGWLDDSSSEEEDDEQTGEEDGEQEGDEHEEAEGLGEVDHKSPPGARHSSKAKQNKRSNHEDNDSHRSGGL